MKSWQCRGVIFDLDGVITQTAKVHFKAWKKTFDAFMQGEAEKSGTEFKPFTYEADYQIYVDGKPRYQGIHSFLQSRGFEVPLGSSKDGADARTVYGIGRRKNDLFREVLDEDGVEIFDSAVEYARQLKARGLRVGMASSSANCQFILEKTGLVDLFETVVDGVVSREMGLKGKPDPDIFIVAAENLGLKPMECMMVEDAISGVQAGRQGNFGLVLGIAREGERENLLSQGADIVVEDFTEFGHEDLDRWFGQNLYEDSWRLTYFGFDPKEERLRETLTAVGNGYLGTRGCMEWERADESVHYPGTYLAGLYNKLPSKVHGKTIWNNDFVNAPNWHLVEIKIGEGAFVSPLSLKCLTYKQTLHMRDAVMERDLWVQDDLDRITRICVKRLASLAQPHLVALQFVITPMNYSDKVTLRTSLDGTIKNYGVPRYRDLNDKHWEPVSVGRSNKGVTLCVETVNSKTQLFMHAMTRFLKDGVLDSSVDKTVQKEPGLVSETAVLEGEEGQPLTMEKVVAVYTTLDRGIENPEKACEDALEAQPSFEDLFKEHQSAWHQFWDKADMSIEGDRFSQKVVRLHMYHLFVTASSHNTSIDAGMPARGLHGEAYRGHIFWDELFIFPFFNLRFPEITRALLMYRYQRLDAARQYARDNGYKGAMYPWQTADDGLEETQEVHYNPVSGHWDPDLSRCQRHVSIAIAYNVWEYFYCTHDLDFIEEFGAEMMLEITRFWASITRKDQDTGKYHIQGVMGPDEFHEKYMGSTEAGIRDNTYTNVMVGWLMHKTIETLEHLPEDQQRKLYEKTSFNPEEIAHWQDIVKNMNVEISDQGILQQFSGYDTLKELDWDRYREKYGDIHRLDRILKSEGDTPDSYKLAKQADTLMLYYLLSPGQVGHILRLMGYDGHDDLEQMQKNYEYYVKRTSHGSTLSLVVHAAILKYLHTHKEDMWEWFANALRSDIHDSQGGTTAEGIHSGVMAGTLDIILKSFVGLNIFKDHFHLEPSLPKHWEKLSFRVCFRKNWFRIELTHQEILFHHESGETGQFKIKVGTAEYTLPDHQPLRVTYDEGKHGRV